MNKLRLVLSIAFLSFGLLAFSQTINEAGDALNNAISHYKAKNFTSAIEEYKKCIEICQSLDSDAAYDLLDKAESSLTKTYLSLGLAQYKAKKFDQAISIFETAQKQAKDSNSQKAATQYLSRVYNSKGTLFFNKDKFAEALAAFDKSLQLDPKYVKAVYGKSLVYKEQDNIAAFVAEMDKLIAMAPETDKTVRKAKSVASGFFIAEGGKALQVQKYAKAVEMLNKGFAYKSGNSQAYYFTAIAYNGLKQWNKAIESANKALSLEKGSKSNIYFELAKAYEGAGNKTQARTTYAKVTDGPNVAAAKHKIENELK